MNRRFEDCVSQKKFTVWKHVGNITRGGSVQLEFAVIGGLDTYIAQVPFPVPMSKMCSGDETGDRKNGLP
jgi:hypothetical protein